MDQELLGIIDGGYEGSNVGSLDGINVGKIVENIIQYFYTTFIIYDNI